MSAEQTAPFYLAGMIACALIGIVFQAARERSRPRGLKPWVDSGK